MYSYSIYVVEEMCFTAPESQLDSVDMDLSIINFRPVDRYLHSLLLHGKLWKIKETELIVMANFPEDGMSSMLINKSETEELV